MLNRRNPAALHSKIHKVLALAISVESLSLFIYNEREDFHKGAVAMKRLLCSFLWFLGLTVVAKLLFVNQPLGYFWIAIGLLSIFFGIHSVNKIELTDNMSVQLAAWIKKYQDLSYFKQQLYLNEVINDAIKRNQTKQALEFLEYILNVEPDNETAKTLMASIWGTALISQQANGHLSR